MVSQILTLLALSAATPAGPATGVRVEALAKAVIVRGIMLRPESVAQRTPDAAPAREASRTCDASDMAPRQCRLIIVDLP